MKNPEAYAHGEIDREIVLTRVVDAPAQACFQAWSDSKTLLQWFGPRGFTCEAIEHGQAQPGAVWRFVMIGPDGHRWGNRLEFVEVIPAERIVFHHGADEDDDPNRFFVTILFMPQDNGKTVVTLRQLHPTKARRDQGIGFGAVELGYQTLDKLAAYAKAHAHAG